MQPVTFTSFPSFTSIFVVVVVELDCAPSATAAVSAKQAVSVVVFIMPARLAPVLGAGCAVRHMERSPWQQGAKIPKGAENERGHTGVREPDERDVPGVEVHS